MKIRHAISLGSVSPRATLARLPWLWPNSALISDSWIAVIVVHGLYNSRSIPCLNRVGSCRHRPCHFGARRESLGLLCYPLYLLAGLAFGNGGLAPLKVSAGFIHIGAEDRRALASIYVRGRVHRKRVGGEPPGWIPCSRR